MTSSWFIHIPHLPTPLSATASDNIACWCWTEKEQPTADNSWTSCTLADLEPCDDQPVTVFLPSLHIVSIRVSVPKKQQRHLAQILPFLCEDKLAGDIEEVHLASGPIHNEEVSVRMVERELLEAVLEKLKLQDIYPQAIYSDAEPLQAQSDTVLWLDPVRSVLVSQQQTLMLPASQTEHLITLLQSKRPQRLTVYRDPCLTTSDTPTTTNSTLALEELRSQGCIINEVPLNAKSADTPPLLPAYRAQGMGLTSSQYVNLLTGPYSPAPQSSYKLRWQPLALIASAFIGLNLLYLLASGVYFELRAQKLQAGSVQLYQHYFPQDKRVVNIRTQTKGHLAQGNHNGNEDFLSTLGQLLPSWEQHQDHLKLKSLRYHSQRKELLLDIESKTISQLDQLQQTLGPRAELLSALEDNGNGARGRIKFQGER